MRIMTFDLETENHTLNKRKASPFDERNYIVQMGWSINGGPAMQTYYPKYHRDPVMPSLEGIDMLIGFNIKFDLLWVWQEKEVQEFLKRGGTIYCGQYAEYLLGGMTQDVQMCSMNSIAESYGGGCKIDAVKELWEAGHLTSEIPRDLLTDYLVGDGKDIVGDVMNTWLIYCGQVQRMKKDMHRNFITMLKLRMDGLLATTEMEYNGMFVDTKIGEQLRIEVLDELDAATIELEEFIPELPPELVFNWNSNVLKSCLIFGGVAKYLKWMPHVDSLGQVIYSKKDAKWPLFQVGKQEYMVDPGECLKAGALYVMPTHSTTKGCIEHGGKYYLVQQTYKSGKKKGTPKYKINKVPNLEKPKGAKQPHYFKFDGYTKPHHTWKGESTDAYDQPLYSVSAGIIDKLAERNLPFTTALSIRTKLAKDLSTYYWTEGKVKDENGNGKKKGMLTLVNEKGIIHHSLNHSSTVTSRTSSNNPNLQTLPRKGSSRVKQMFVSRFGVHGRVGEIDYSQLEVVIQGVLSGDKQLCQDLRDKIDFHCKRLAAKLGEDYQYVWDKCHIEGDLIYKDWRTSAKEFSFQRAYGAGVDAIVTSTGMSKKDVISLVEAELLLYPGIHRFDKKLAAMIDRSRIGTENKIFIDGVAFTQGEGHWDSPTGTRYIWREGITPEYMHKTGKYVGFSPTERKNYPVQGFGGEVVQTMLGKVFRYVIANDRFGGDLQLMNTVHDCLQIDGKTEVMTAQLPVIQQIMEDVPHLYNTMYDNLNIDVPFPCESEIGNDLFDMHAI